MRSGRWWRLCGLCNVAEQWRNPIRQAIVTDCLCLRLQPPARSASFLPPPVPCGCWRSRPLARTQAAAADQHRRPSQSSRSLSVGAKVGGLACSSPLVSQRLHSHGCPSFSLCASCPLLHAFCICLSRACHQMLPSISRSPCLGLCARRVEALFLCTAPHGFPTQSKSLPRAKC